MKVLNPQILLGAILLILDQLSKYFFLSNYPHLISKNEGIAFSIPIPWQISFSVGIVALWIIYKISKTEHIENKWFLPLFTAGTLGNMADRIINNYVIDFIDLGFMPVFNLADTYLSLAVLILILENLKK